MKTDAKTVEEYLQKVPEGRRAFFSKLRDTIRTNLPEGFQEKMSYGMIGYVVPHSIFPNGYHANPELPLPFVNIASQKNYIALYHMGLYADPEILDWFVREYPKHSKLKLDIGKSCIRFKKPDQIPFELIGQLMQKLTVTAWIRTYQEQIKK